MARNRTADREHAPHHVFERVARAASKVLGSAAAFIVAAGIVVLWAVSGPLFGFSQTWQLVINTGTTIVTFLMVFLVQATQNRDTIAVHQKLDELIEATKAAHDDVVGLEDAPPEVVERVKRDHARRRRQEQAEAERTAS
jgi:low affinity Fe/Cu permease